VKAILGILALAGCFFLGHAERVEMKVEPIVYWFTWLLGGIACVTYVGTQIGGVFGFAAGAGLGLIYSVAIYLSHSRQPGGPQHKNGDSDDEAPD